jgi:hypothetical protein
MYVTCHCHNNGKSNHREEATMGKKAATAAKPSDLAIWHKPRMGLIPTVCYRQNRPATSRCNPAVAP